MIYGSRRAKKLLEEATVLVLEEGVPVDMCDVLEQALEEFVQRRQRPQAKPLVNNRTLPEGQDDGVA